jgi:4-amino-4-deoxy-L-arabinose transferase-like glycosyltransferase
MRLPPIQECIHWLEIGQGARTLRILAGILLLLTIAFWYDYSQFRNFNAPEAMEVSQLARNLARGDGYTTQVIRPLSLQLVEDHQGVEASLSRGRHPDLFSPPLYPFLLAGWMNVMPFEYKIPLQFWRYQPEVLIAVFNQLLFCLTVWLCYRLARRLLSGEAGVLVAITLFSSELLWRFSISGLPTMLAMLLVVCLLWTLAMLEENARLHRHRRKPFWIWASVAGLVLGLLGLTRYAALALIIPSTLFFLFFLGRRAVTVTLITWAVCAAVVTPWLVRNYQTSGTLFGLRSYAAHMDTIRFPGTRLERNFKPDLTVMENPDYVRKGGEGLRTILANDLLRIGGTWMSTFFLVGLLGQYGKPALNRLRVFLMFSLITLAVLQSVGRTYLSTASPTVNSENLLVLLTPGVFLLGIAFYFWILNRVTLPFREFRHIISATLVVLCALPLLTGFLPPRVIPESYPPYFPPYLQEASQLLKSSELLMTDAPWATAWYGDRTSAQVPLDTRKSFFEINDRHKQVSAVLLTPLSTDAQFRRQIIQSREHEWSRLALEVFASANVPRGFPLTNAWKEGTPDHLFLADRARWQETRRDNSRAPLIPER